MISVQVLLLPVWWREFWVVGQLQTASPPSLVWNLSSYQSPLGNKSPMGCQSKEERHRSDSEHLIRWTTGLLYVQQKAKDVFQSYLWGALAGWCGGRCWSKALSFQILRGGGGDMERLAGRQRGKRQIQLVIGGGKHYIIVERDILQQLYLWICTTGQRTTQLCSISEYQQ